MCGLHGLTNQWQQATHATAVRQDAAVLLQLQAHRGGGNLCVNVNG